MKAFKPKKSLFLHCCANCDNGKRVLSIGGSPLGYICTKREGTERLFGSHICDIEVDGTGEQISWFDEIEALKEE